MSIGNASQLTIIIIVAYIDIVPYYHRRIEICVVMSCPSIIFETLLFGCQYS